MARRPILFLVYVIICLQVIHIKLAYSQMEPSSLKDDTIQDSRLIIALKNLAGEEDAEAYYVLAMKYEEGKGVLKSHSLSHKLLKKSVSLGNRDAMYELGNWYYRHSWISFFLRPSLPRQWHRRAAELGHEMAKRSLMTCIAMDIRSTEEDVRDMIQWLREFSEKGDLSSKLTLTNYVSSKERVKLLLELTNVIESDVYAGVGVEARYKLGALLADDEEGEGIIQNIPAAIHWLRKAAEAGHSRALLKLGELAEREEAGLTIWQAVEFYEKAATDSEDSRAMRRLTIIYREGRRGVAPNPDRELHYLRQLHILGEYGDEYSDYRLGCLLEVQANEADLQEAFRCLKMVCDHAPDTTPFPDLEFRVGRMYEEGRGTKQDDGQAAHYYKLALRKGNAEAGERLARLHAQGRGLTTLERLRGKPSTSPSSCAIV